VRAVERPFAERNFGLARAQGAVAERDRLSQQLMHFQDQTEKERCQAAGRVAVLQAELAEVRKSERAALERWGR
jgi:hypothetical protein